jgi:hypothetical protein
VALARPAQSPEAVYHTRLQPDQPLAILVLAFSKPTDPSGMVATMASKAAWLMAMRTIGSS